MINKYYIELGNNFGEVFNITPFAKNPLFELNKTQTPQNFFSRNYTP